MIFKKGLTHLGLSTKNIILNILIIMLVMFITGFVVFTYSYNFMYNQEKLLGDEALNKLQVFAKNESNTVFNQYTMIHSNMNISNLFAEFYNGYEHPYSVENIKYIQNYLSNFLTADTNVSEYILVTLQGNVYADYGSSFRNISPSFDYYNYPLIKKLMNSEDNTIMEFDDKIPYIRNDKTPVVSYLGKIYDSRQFPKKVVIGFFIINIPCTEYSKSFFSFHGTLKGDLILSNKDRKIVFSTNEQLQGKKIEEINTEGSNISEKAVDISGAKAIKVVNKSAFTKDINALQLSILPMFFIGIFLTIILTTLLHRTYKNKLNMIAVSMNNIQHGNLSTRLPVTSKDEIGKLSGTFNNMCEQLTRFIKLNYQFETQKKIAEMNALQAQINPHFLYNTIDSIRSEAIRQNDQTTADMLVRLANMFRYSSDFSENIIFIEDELDYVVNYLELQKIRFKNDFQYKIKVDNSLLYNGMPKLVMQPIVENALLHGLKNQVSKKITIQIYQSAGVLFIDIADNGCGLTPENVERIRQYLNEPDAQDSVSYGIGIINVHNRINLLFSGDFGLRIESTMGKGTLVTLIIPALGKGEMKKCIK